jgi:hypothetical protein
MRLQFRILYPDGTEAATSAEMSAPPTESELRAFLEPLLDGVMQEVACSEGRMFVDDLALFKDAPRNEAATSLYREVTRHGIAVVLEG